MNLLRREHSKTFIALAILLAANVAVALLVGPQACDWYRSLAYVPTGPVMHISRADTTWTLRMRTPISSTTFSGISFDRLDPRQFEKERAVQNYVKRWSWLPGKTRRVFIIDRWGKPHPLNAGANALYEVHVLQR